MQSSIKTGGGCGPKRMKDRESVLREMFRPKTESELLAARLKREAEHEAWLKTPEGIAWMLAETQRLEREAKRITHEEWSRLFNELLDHGFQPGDIATVEKPLLPTIHHKTGRACVYV